MANYTLQKIFLKSNDGAILYFAKLNTSQNIMRISIENLENDALVSFSQNDNCFYIENDVPFGFCPDFPFAIAIIKNSAVIAKYLSDSRALFSSQIPAPVYDDEQISEVNYYDNRLIGGLFDEQPACNNNAQTESNITEKAKNDEISITERPDDKDADFDKKWTKFNYYETKRKLLFDLFSHGKRLRELELVIDSSVFYSFDFAKHKHLAIGIIQKNNDPGYIVFGIKGNFGEKPKNTQYNCFVPLSLTDFHGDRYYLFFEDAITGKTIDYTVFQ